MAQQFPNVSSITLNDAKEDPEDAIAKREMLEALLRGNSKRVPRGQATVTNTAEHKFWSTQPVPRLEEKPDDHGPIEFKTLDDVPKEPVRNFGKW